MLGHKLGNFQRALRAKVDWEHVQEIEEDLNKKG